MQYIVYKPGEYPTKKYPVKLPHPVARTIEGYFVYPWVICNLHPGDPYTRILVVSLNANEIEGQEMLEQNHVRSALANGPSFWVNGLRIVTGVNFDGVAYLEYPSEEASQFLYDCLEWFNAIDQVPEDWIPEDCKAYIPDKK